MESFCRQLCVRGWGTGGKSGLGPWGPGILGNFQLRGHGGSEGGYPLGV